MSGLEESLPSVQSLSISTNAATSGNEYNLSQVGLEAAAKGDLVFIWKMLANLWHPQSNPDGIVSLGVAENALMHEKLVHYLKDNFELSEKSLTYGEGGMGSIRLRKAVSHFLNRRLQPFLPLESDHMVMTNGCSSAIEHCSYMFANPGDGILLGRPYYGTFTLDITLRPRVKVVTVCFGDIDPIGADAVQYYERALIDAESSGTNIKALVLCNPHNPLGRCYSRDTIVSLMKLCQKYDIHFISDEIYAFSVFDNREDKSPPQVDFVSALSIDLTGIIKPHLVHVLWGMSKDFGANGLRLGTIISQSNSKFREALCLVSLYSFPSSMVDGTIAKLLEDDAFTDEYIAENQKKLSQRYSFVVSFLKKHDIEYSPGVNAAFFLWINLGKSYLDRHPELVIEDVSSVVMQKMLDKEVFLANGTAYGSEKPGWYRLVFSQNEDYLMEGLQRMLSAIQN